MPFAFLSALPLTFYQGDTFPLEGNLSILGVDSLESEAEVVLLTRLLWVEEVFSLLEKTGGGKGLLAPSYSLLEAEEEGFLFEEEEDEDLLYHHHPL